MSFNWLESLQNEVLDRAERSSKIANDAANKYFSGYLFLDEFPLHADMTGVFTWLQELDVSRLPIALQYYCKLCCDKKTAQFHDIFAYYICHENASVKESSITAIGSIMAHARDIKIVRLLVGIIDSHSEENHVKCAAYTSLFAVTGIPIYEFHTADECFSLFRNIDVAVINTEYIKLCVNSLIHKLPLK
jgi:hypothetical protein